MKFHDHASRKIQTNKRQHKFAQKRNCYVMRFVIRNIVKKKIIVVRQNVSILLIQTSQRIRFTKNNEYDFVETSIKNKSIKKIQMLINNDEKKTNKCKLI